MGRNRSTARQARGRSRLALECLETRQLLSTLSAVPASSANPDLNGDGTVDVNRVIEASAARSAYQVDGTGQSVAVIDTGVDYKNPALGGAVGPGNKVIAGVDFSGSPNGILPSAQHGTGVAGVIASNAAGDLGIAPGVEIVALRVFGDNGQGSFDEVARALDWVVAHHSEYNITAVNLSVSDGGNYLTNRFATDGSVGQHITTSIKALDTLNIPVVVAAGNSFDGKTQGQGFSSIVPDAVSVTATDVTGVQADGTGEKLASDAQRLGTAKGGIYATKLAAPGVNIVAPSGDGGTAKENGTSFAAPQVTGAIVLLQQSYEKAYHTPPTVAQLEGWLQQGAATIHDPVTGIDIGRLDVLHSLQVLDGQIHPAVPSTPDPVTPTTIVPIIVVAPTPTPTPTLTPTPAPTPPPVQPTTTVADSAPAPKATVPMTEIILNGTSIGSFATSDLAAEFAGFFRLSKGATSRLRAWVPTGSVPILGASKPSGVSLPLATAAARGTIHPGTTSGHPKASEAAKAVGAPGTHAHARRKKHNHPFFFIPFF